MPYQYRQYEQPQIQSPQMPDLMQSVGDVINVSSGLTNLRNQAREQKQFETEDQNRTFIQSALQSAGNDTPYAIQILTDAGHVTAANELWRVWQGDVELQAKAVSAETQKSIDGMRIATQFAQGGLEKNDEDLLDYWREHRNQFVNYAGGPGGAYEGSIPDEYATHEVVRSFLETSYQMGLNADEWGNFQSRGQEQIWNSIRNAKSFVELQDMVSAGYAISLQGMDDDDDRVRRKQVSQLFPPQFRQQFLDMTRDDFSVYLKKEDVLSPWSKDGYLTQWARRKYPDKEVSELSDAQIQEGFRVWNSLVEIQTPSEGGLTELQINHYLTAIDEQGIPWGDLTPEMRTRLVPHMVGRGIRVTNTSDQRQLARDYRQARGNLLSMSDRDFGRGESREERLATLDDMYRKAGLEIGEPVNYYDLFQSTDRPEAPSDPGNPLGLNPDATR